MTVDRRCLARFAGLFCLVTVVWALVAVPAVYAFELENVTAWKWTGETQCLASAVGDVDGDGSVEVITGGYYADGLRSVAQLCVWNGSTLALEQVTTWYWTDNTRICSVAVGDVDGDQSVEIATGGCFNDGMRDVAQLCVWDGATLALENVQTWYWVADTVINSVVVADVDGDGYNEIVTGGYYNDGAAKAQLCVWDGATLALENVTAWYWVPYTRILSVAVGDVDGDQSIEIVTGGYYGGNAQLCVWDGSTLALEQVTAWYWTGITCITSVAVGDVDADGDVEIVTGGYYYDAVLYNAQLCIWDGSTLALEQVTAWNWTEDTLIFSVAVGDVDGDQSTEIVTGGRYWAGTYSVAQLCVWSGSDLALEDVTVWYWVSNTYLVSVAVGDVDDDASVEIVTGGYYYGYECYAQLTVWTSASDG